MGETPPLTVLIGDPNPAPIARLVQGIADVITAARQGVSRSLVALSSVREDVPRATEPDAPTAGALAVAVGR